MSEETEPEAAPEPSREPSPEPPAPFAPPADYQLEEELRAPVPRPVPPRFTKGLYERSRRLGAWAVLLTGGGFLLFGRLPLIEDLGHYFLPFAYSTWIGYALILTAVVMAVMNYMRPGKFAYVKGGIAFPAQVERTFMHMRSVGQGQEYFHVIETLGINPETGKLTRFKTVGSEKFTLYNHMDYSLDLKGGDWVTMIYLPGQITDTLRVYSLLGLDPNVNHFLHKGRPANMLRHRINTIITCLIVLVGVASVVTAGMSITPLFPEGGISSTGALWTLPFVLAGAVLSAWFAARRMRGGDSLASTKVAFTAMAGGGGAVLGGLVGLLTVVLLNAKLDRSDGNYTPVRVGEIRQTTYNGIVRTYNAEVMPINSKGSFRESVSYDLIENISASRCGVRAIRPGAFGMEWNAGIYPVVFAEASPSMSLAKTRRVEIMDPKTAQVELHVLCPVIELPSGRIIDPPKEIEETLWKGLAAQHGVKVRDRAPAIDASDPIPRI